MQTTTFIRRRTANNISAKPQTSGSPALHTNFHCREAFVNRSSVNLIRTSTWITTIISGAYSYYSSSTAAAKRSEKQTTLTNSNRVNYEQQCMISRMTRQTRPFLNRLTSKHIHDKFHIAANSRRTRIHRHHPPVSTCRLILPSQSAIKSGLQFHELTECLQTRTCLKMALLTSWIKLHTLRNHDQTFTPSATHAITQKTYVQLVNLKPASELGSQKFVWSCWQGN